VNHTHTPAEWGDALLFGSLSWLTCSILIATLAPVDFDRPMRDAALTAAALLVLLLSAPEGATR
jgi:hypothetical protein